jgi:hypothetical protein
MQLKLKKEECIADIFMSSVINFQLNSHDIYLNHIKSPRKVDYKKTIHLN